MEKQNHLFQLELEHFKLLKLPVVEPEWLTRRCDRKNFFNQLNWMEKKWLLQRMEMNVNVSFVSRVLDFKSIWMIVKIRILLLNFAYRAWAKNIFHALFHPSENDLLSCGRAKNTQRLLIYIQMSLQRFQSRWNVAWIFCTVQQSAFCYRFSTLLHVRLLIC